MIEVSADKNVVRMVFPTEGMSPEQVNDFVTWLRVEAIARRSQLTDTSAWKLSEDTKSDWWEANKRRFGE